MALYANRLQVPIKELSADWIPEEGELFQDSSDNLYMGDNVTASNALTPINGGGGGGGGTIEHDPFGYSATTNPSGIGIAELRFNSTTFGSITKMYVSDNDQNAVDLVAEQSIMTSGVAKLYKAEGGKLSFQVTRMVDQSGYFEYDVLPLSGTMPTVGEVCYVDFVPDAPGVRKVRLVLSQADTDAPTEVDEVLWSVPGTRSSYLYHGPGVYSLELVDGIDLTTLTPVSPMIADAAGKTCVTTVLAANKLQITTTEDGMTGFMVAIDLYS